MTQFVAIAVTLALDAIALLHVYWALGGLWPGTDERTLARIVVGIPEMTRMPPLWMKAVVALALSGMAAWQLLLAPAASNFIPSGLIAALTACLAALFLGRGFAGYLPALQRRHSAQPFASLNRKYYSPICLALGAGFLCLAFEGAFA